MSFLAPLHISMVATRRLLDKLGLEHHPGDSRNVGFTQLRPEHEHPCMIFSSSTEGRAVGKMQHLLSASLAALILATSLGIGSSYANQVENDYIHSLVSVSTIALRTNGALQRAAVRQPDLLLFYGSSELKTGGPFNGAEFFKTYPSGFAVFGVSKNSADAIILLQEIAGLGSGLKGKRIVISFSPEFFLWDETPAVVYESNFSAVDANQFIFSSALDLSVKESGAKRMLDYPQTLKREPLLKFATENLASGTLGGRVLYLVAFPLGRLQLWALRLGEHWQALADIRGIRGLSANVKRKSSSLDWASLVDQSTHSYQEDVGDDPFGLADAFWEQNKQLWTQQKNDLFDQRFATLLRRSGEWGDLSLLLMELRELGAEPLIVTTPWDGFFYDYRGVSAAARAQYYEMLSQVGHAYGVSVVSFGDHEYDKLFFLDVGHPSMKGWVYYDQALDAFYHGNLR
jgi:D-alanyl-lipoteichoic acid biosynthesis protein DltD